MSKERPVFLDVDTQVDFMSPGGALYVPGAETILPNLRRLMAYAAAQHLLILSSADAHEPDDASFCLWPPHCITGTAGQQRVAETRLPSPLVIHNQPGSFEPPLPRAGQVIIEKIDYDVSSNPNFDAILQALGSSRFAVFGVATEYCVRASGLALRRRGFPVDLVADAIKALSGEGRQKALEEMTAAGARLVTTASILSGFCEQSRDAGPA